MSNRFSNMRGSLAVISRFRPFHASILPAFLMTGLTWASDFQSPRTAALGGAGRAGPLLNDAITLNPSFAAFLRERVSAGITYNSFSPTPDMPVPSGSTPVGEGRNYQVSLQDGRSPFFEAGVAYTQFTDGSMIHVGASRTFIQRMGFGLGAKFQMNEDRSQVVSDGSLSMTGVITPEIQAALVVDNLFQSGRAQDAGLFREFALGTKLNVMGIVLLYLDPHYIPELPETLGRKFGYELGAEFVMFQDVFLRTGFFRDSKTAATRNFGTGWSLGAGWLGPKLSFDLGFSRAVDPVPADSWTFGATLYL